MKLKMSLSSWIALGSATFAYSCGQSNLNKISSTSKEVSEEQSLGIGGASSTASNGLISISSHQNMAGAISSLKYGGKEFINNYDHGRQYQVAWVVDYLQRNAEGCVECLNPTEAGNRNDKGISFPSTSVLQSIRYSGNVMATTSRPAYWMAPGDRNSAQGNLYALNKEKLSDYTLSKQVTVGYGGNRHAIEFLTTIQTPRAMNSIQVEAPTAYLNAEFTNLYSYNPKTNSLIKLPPTYQDRFYFDAVIISTPDGRYAMGAWAPEHAGFQRAYAIGYFAPGAGAAADFATSKWSIVMRGNNIKAGRISFRSFQFVGSLDNVRLSMQQTVSQLTTGSVVPTPKPPISVVPTPKPPGHPLVLPGQIYSQGLFRVGAGIYYSNGKSSFCGYSSQEHLKSCGMKGKRVSKKSGLPSGMRNDGACSCGKPAPAPVAPPPPPAKPAQPAQPVGVIFQEGLFRVGVGIYYSNGRNAYCGFSSPEHLKRCGNANKPYIQKSTTPNGMRYDGACGC